MSERMMGPEGDLGGDEEAGPEECEAKVAETEVRAGELEESPDASHPRFSEEVTEAYSPEPSLMVPHPDDGLPSPADESSDLLVAPAFTYDTMVCVADDREWVEVSDEQPCEPTPPLILEDLGIFGIRIGAPPPVERLSEHSAERRKFPAQRVLREHGRAFVVLDGSVIWVRPVREQCRYYMRQVFSNDSVPDPNEPGHRIVFRNCSARRSIGGAFLSLRDEAVYACTLRDPPHQESVDKYLDGPDTAKLRGTVPTPRLPLFIDTTTGEPK